MISSPANAARISASWPRTATTIVTADCRAIAHPPPCVRCLTLREA